MPFMSLLEICQWIENTPSSTALRESILMFPIIEGSHVLGLGLSVPYISWGTMIRDAQDFLEVAPWLAIFPGLALAGVILAFTIVGDALRDRMDPRMRSSLSRRLV